MLNSRGGGGGRARTGSLPVEGRALPRGLGVGPVAWSSWLGGSGNAPCSGPGVVQRKRPWRWRDLLLQEARQLLHDLKAVPIPPLTVSRLALGESTWT